MLQSFVLRNPGAIFYAKRKEKTVLLAKYLDRKVENLDDLGCPRVEFFFQKLPKLQQTYTSLQLQESLCPEEKQCFFYDWLKNEQQRKISESGDIPITKFNALCVHDRRG